MAALPIIGALISGVGTIASGIAANNAAQQEAMQLEEKGKEELAASQRDADQKRREGALINSRQQAVAAASGAGAGMDAPTIVKLMTDTAGQAEYNAQVDLYGGKSRKEGLFNAAANRRREGKASLLGSVLGGFGSFAKAWPN
ncbi:MAG: hypothetical protein M9939_00675 [Mesorhizobium sp.]|nr:hypothetical protein [Mesorhizobium sp.]MCO5159621.1 hypothetical protein [Mesorhizobium sp.]